ncbi:unnamed protein product [Cyclocybe aegerita]|uniref:Uncharacterized protein n=1 Tax=Cyclocybe aegerita TaxID=1973307 RepID=A0A8S0XTB5_CYCAE|nr:unnamed protein product [Cyclocybe aegerita]
MSDPPKRGRSGKLSGISGRLPPTIPPALITTSVSSSSFQQEGALPIAPDPTSTRATYTTNIPACCCCSLSHHSTQSQLRSAHLSDEESDSGTAQALQEMEVEGSQASKVVSRDVTEQPFDSQYSLKLRGTVNELSGDLEVVTSLLEKTTDWLLQATHHNPTAIEGANAFTDQIVTFVNAIMSTNFSHIRTSRTNFNLTLASLLVSQPIPGSQHNYLAPEAVSSF